MATIKVGGAYVENNRGQLLIVQELEGHWKIPTETCQPNRNGKGESHYEAIIRGVREETGLDIRIISDGPIHWSIYAGKGQDVTIERYDYVAEVTGGRLTHRKGELRDAKWITVSVLEKMMGEYSSDSPYHSMLKSYLHFRKNRKTGRQ